MATAMNGLPAGRDLKRLLEQAQKDYQANLDNLTDAATDEIETAIQRGDIDLKELVSEYARDASQLANEYYDQLRGLWAEQSSEPMPEFLHAKLVDPSRVLWQVEHGFSNTDFNGLTYQQVMEGRSRAGMTIDDLWPPLDNVDDAQQFIADMINASGRLTMQRNIKLDPTRPKWARVCGSAKPCAFCVMLASRGFAYNSQETADFGSGFHDGHCHCSVVPSWGRDEHLLARQAQWKSMYDAGKREISEAEGSGKHAAPKTSFKDVLAAMRRMFSDKLGDGVETRAPSLSPELDRRYKLSKPLKHFSQLTSKAVNPNIGNVPQGVYDPYGNNCQRCCQVAELRLRGYDVIAAPRGMYDQTGIRHFYISNWMTRDGKQRRWTNCAPRRKADSILKELESYPVGARFFIRGSWKTKGGHVWNAEIVMKNGRKTVKMYDFQGEDRDPDGYLSRVKNGGSSYIRVDDMFPSDALMDGHRLNFDTRLPKPTSWVIGAGDHAPTTSEANAAYWGPSDRQIDKSWGEYVRWSYSSPDAPAVKPNGREMVPKK
ncbi:Papain fold toxin 1 [Bifidobacterium margollesii]|uniref:Papain fold toxin 1 n=1 Tax=Bifidobacterium margollesii TaxID=2020964 RepID=A0A2N5J6V6_9BIFI|nr:toxin glutamine deamidase domain-containing protein [Bifidobacterium margollesii]PLS29934.1 Papain fold toxin 1 [Bifidobacterium margollesii]